MEIFSRPQRRHFHKKLPYLAASLGIVVSVGVWYYLMHDLPSSTPEHLYLSGFILLLGISISFLLGITIHLIQLSRQRSYSLRLVNRDFKKELIQHKESEKTKEILEKALLQSQKLQAVGTLASGIAHDFNNILYAIIGYVEMAREDVEKDSLIHKNLGKVLDASNRGKELISRLLTFSRRQHVDFKPINLQMTIENVLSLIKPAIPASVTIQLKSNTDGNLVFGNQTQLHQVLVNIINNAVDAMDGEGSITLTMNPVPAGDDILKRFPSMRNLNYLKIEIIDTGHGIDQTTMERVFEPFFTTKEVGKGTGLGLATAHAIIKEHQGEILIESELGHGSKFIILLPEYSEKESANGKNFAG